MRSFGDVAPWCFGSRLWRLCPLWLVGVLRCCSACTIHICICFVSILNWENLIPWLRTWKSNVCASSCPINASSQRLVTSAETTKLLFPNNHRSCTSSRICISYSSTYIHCSCKCFRTILFIFWYEDRDLMWRYALMHVFLVPSENLINRFCSCFSSFRTAFGDIYLLPNSTRSNLMELSSLIISWRRVSSFSKNCSNWSLKSAFCRMIPLTLDFHARTVSPTASLLCLLTSESEEARGLLDPLLCWGVVGCLLWCLCELDCLLLALFVSDVHWCFWCFHGVWKVVHELHHRLVRHRCSLVDALLSCGRLDPSD